MSETATPAPADHRQFTCPACQELMPCYDAAHSEYYACTTCWAYSYAPQHGPAVVLKHYKKPPSELGLLPVGKAGTLNGQACRVTGYTRRNERGTTYFWSEYQVYFPGQQAYVQLALYAGHWLLVRPAGQTYQVTDAGTRTATVPTSDNVFKIYNSYRGCIQFADGEFDWDIEGDGDLWVREYTCPPQLLVEEADGTATTWYLGEHLEPTAVATAFGLDPATLPSRVGVGAAQPSPYLAGRGARRQLSWLMVAVLLAVQMGFWSARPRQEVFRQTFDLAPDAQPPAGTNKVLVGETFTIDNTTTLDIGLETSLNNQWLELPVSLVNEETGRGFSFTKNLEFYQGVESGEHWQEGEFTGEAQLARVPAGRYHFNLYPFTEAPKPGVVPPPLRVQITATENPFQLSNLWIAVALALAYPFVQGWRNSRWEGTRWEASDYAPKTDD
jgi:Domain of unknown function (DUF4178)